MKSKPNTLLIVSLGILSGILLVALGYGARQFLILRDNSQVDKVMLEEQVHNLELRIKEITDENAVLADALYREQNKNSEFEEQIRSIAGTVGVLDKLAKTDKELLQKYSKVYFLNEHYTPSSLSTIDPDYVVQTAREEKIHSEVLLPLTKMIEDGEKDGVSLRVVSAYRSFATQSALKSRYTVLYGSGANQFSADQGYSEHQLGTAVDFSTAQLGTQFTQFGETKAYKWLTENAHRYGFILSYPPNNAYYQYEPWHWRFVGIKLARTLHNENMFFYDMDQREIDPYLVTLFD